RAGRRGVRARGRGWEVGDPLSMAALHPQPRRRPRAGSAPAAVLEGGAPAFAEAMTPEIRYRLPSLPCSRGHERGAMSEAIRRAGSLGLLFFLAGRGLLRSPLSTMLLLAAVAAGVGFQVPNTANMLGYQRALLEEGVDHGNGDVRLRPRAGRFEDADA